jgi:hypothetical protein
MNEYQKTFDLCLKIFVYGMVALYFLGFLKFLPDDLSDRANENHHLPTECSNVVRGSPSDPPTEHETSGRVNPTGSTTTESP